MTAIYPALLPLPSRTDLLEAFLRKKLKDVPTPAAIVDIAAVKRNCDQMLKACNDLQLDFRPHVKTHKTSEVTQMQIGETAREFKIIVSTVAEAEHHVDQLVKARNDGKNINILYGLPLPPSQVEKLAYLGRQLGPRSISVLIDDVCQLPAVDICKTITAFPIQIFIKVDTGYHRAGLPSSGQAFQRLVQAAFEMEFHDICVLAGFYSHAGHSYGGSTTIDALETLKDEIEGLEKAAATARSLRYHKASSPPYILSVGASPTSTSLACSQEDGRTKTFKDLKSIIERVKRNHILEIHAGVYPFLDLQQLATHASPSAMAAMGGMQASMSLADLALTILVEVASVYKDREKPEALIAAGTLALGREPCKSYDGWGIVSGWGCERAPSARSGWKIRRISQEHSVLTEDFDNDQQEQAVLCVGQKIRVFPNHACVATTGFSWYLIVDSSLPEERQDEVVDVWVRCRGW